MYPVLLFVHSALRWFVLLALVAASVRALRGWRGSHGWSSSDAHVGAAAVAGIDLQLLLGLLLYGVFSPITRAAMADFGAAMRVGTTRFFAVEHLALGVLIVVAVHVTRVASRRAADDRAKHRRAAIGYGLTLLLAMATVPWPFMAYGRPLFRGV